VPNNALSFFLNLIPFLVNWNLMNTRHNMASNDEFSETLTKIRHEFETSISKLKGIISYEYGV
jgi:hypothetical protein